MRKISKKIGVKYNEALVEKWLDISMLKNSGKIPQLHRTLGSVENITDCINIKTRDTFQCQNIDPISTELFFCHSSIYWKTQQNTTHFSSLFNIDLTRMI